jgi:hypothetical protein
MRWLLLAGMLLAAEPALAQAPVLVPLMGKRLFGPGGEELGRLVDLVADAEGRPVAVVVDVGGFMGLGSRRVALPWSVLRFRREANMVRLSIEIAPDRVTAAPEFRPDDPTTILTPPAVQ